MRLTFTKYKHTLFESTARTRHRYGNISVRTPHARATHLCRRNGLLFPPLIRSSIDFRRDDAGRRPPPDAADDDGRRKRPAPPSFAFLELTPEVPSPPAATPTPQVRHHCLMLMATTCGSPSATAAKAAKRASSPSALERRSPSVCCLRAAKARS